MKMIMGWMSMETMILILAQQILPEVTERKNTIPSLPNLEGPEQRLPMNN